MFNEMYICLSVKHVESSIIISYMIFLDSVWIICVTKKEEWIILFDWTFLEI